jgi:glycine betaine/proline transport system ATP-binding protein
MTTEKIRLTSLFKNFGPDPKKALGLLNSGVGKDEILARSGNVVGVSDVNLSINEGEIFVVMGLSGSGKSTLVRLLNRLIEPTSGSVFYNGTDIAKLSKSDLIQLRRRDMGMVFQSFALLPHMTVIENVGFGLELSGVSEKERSARGRDALERVGLKNFAHSYPAELSGGMQQRVGIARALANNPSVMLMDEAFSALDPLIRTEMQDELLAIQRAQKRTIVFISHDLNEAMRIGDRVAVMQGGSVVQIGSPEDILTNPANDYVRSFFRGVDVSKVFTARDIVRDEQEIVLSRDGTKPDDALRHLQSANVSHGYVLGADREFCGVVSQQSLQAVMAASGRISDAYVQGVEPVSSMTIADQIVRRVARGVCPLPVVDENSRYLGVVSKSALLECFDRREDVADGNR